MVLRCLVLSDSTFMQNGYFIDSSHALTRHLQPDEELLWTGTPKQGLQLTSSDVFLIPFSLLWGGFAIFWEVSVISSDAPFFFMLFGVPFVLVGLYMIFGRFLFDSARRRNTIYGLTKSRIIIKSGVFSKSLKSLNIKTISDITLEEKSDGTGTILLGAQTNHSGLFRFTGWPGFSHTATPALEMIPSARQIYMQITELQQKD